MNLHDAGALELGVKFRSAVDATVTGVRYYRSSNTTSSAQTGTLWSNGGTALGTTVFSQQTASGWQTAYFATPIAITANTLYVISCFSPDGYYSASPSYFNDPHQSYPLTAPADIDVSGNGVIHQGGHAFPTDPWNFTCYWVDVLVAYTLPPDTTPPSAPTSLCSSCPNNVVTLDWVLASDTVVVDHYNIYRGGSHVGSSQTTTYVDSAVADT